MTGLIAMTHEDKAKMLDKLPGMVYQFTYTPPTLPIIFAAKGCKALTGYTPEELTGFELMDLVHPDDVGFLGVLHGETLSIGEPLETTFRMISKHGEEKLVLSRSRVAKTNDVGMPHIIEGLLVDVTKQMRINSALTENHGQAALLSEMGHWIRTPMNAILGIAELGLRADMPDTVRDYIHTIKRAGSELMAALTNAQDYSKLQTGEMTILDEEYALTSFVDDTVNTILPRIQAAGLEFALYVDSKLPALLTGDEMMLQKILLNLLLNAVKFTKRGYVSLAITGEIADDICNLEIKVSDTGRGIKEEDLPRLFVEFSQFDTQNVDGAGLGLAISKKVAHLMGGEIAVVSAYGAGSIFTVTVPQHIRKSGSIARDLPPERKSAVVFDRHKTVGETICLALEDLGARYRQAFTAQDFHEALSSGDYAFAFVDDKLYAKYLDEYPTPSAKIVLLTERDETALNGGCFAVLSRPVYCLPVANILNCGPVAAGLRMKLTAPEARVLIVDDIAFNLTVTEELLRPWKMNIDVCESGADAIKAVKSKHYDLILMDYKMPVMSGVGATIAIRELGVKNIPIIALTASVENYTRELFRQSGFSDILAKPIEIHKLNGIIEKWLPAEKLHTEPEYADKSVAGSAAEIKIEGVDVETGILMAGGKPETYLLILGKYCENGRRMATELQACLDRNDTRMYGVYVHALKSLSASIGASAFSKFAADLERAVERSDHDFIYGENANFIAAMENILDNIESVLPTQSGGKEIVQMTEPKKKILLIDDTTEFLFLMTEILKDTYDTIVSTDGEDGLETAKITMPDLIIVDIIMPGMSGIEVLDALKRDDTLKNIPVIMMSGNKADNNPGIIERGAEGYLEKPFKPAEAKSLINTVLKQREGQE